MLELADAASRQYAAMPAVSVILHNLVGRILMHADHAGMLQ